MHCGDAEPGPPLVLHETGDHDQARSPSQAHTPITGHDQLKRSRSRHTAQPDHKPLSGKSAQIGLTGTPNGQRRRPLMPMSEYYAHPPSCAFSSPIFVPRGQEITIPCRRKDRGGIPDSGPRLWMMSVRRLSAAHFLEGGVRSGFSESGRIDRRNSV